jgi:sugar/nucleoside kinase (ribokinase family)
VKQVDLIGCGAVNLDLIYRLPASFALWDELPPAGSELLAEPALKHALEEALAHVTPQRSGGGQAANTVYALAQMGFASEMLGRVGDDEDGRWLLADLAPAQTTHVARQGHTGRVFVLLDDDGERRNLVDPAANDDFCPADLPRRLPRTRFAFFTSFVGEGPLAAQAALLARLPADVEVAFDPGEIYARMGVKRFIPFLKRCAYLFATDKELELLCGIPKDEAVSFLLNVGVGLIVCKMGSRGARLIGRRVDMYVPPLPAEVVDVTGAGDLFAAGFIGGLIAGTGLEAAGRLAAWAASRGISGVGRSSYPTAEQWRERLAEERGDGGGWQ